MVGIDNQGRSKERAPLRVMFVVQLPMDSPYRSLPVFDFLQALELCRYTLTMLVPHIIVLLHVADVPRAANARSLCANKKSMMDCFIKFLTGLMSITSQGNISSDFNKLWEL